MKSNPVSKTILSVLLVWLCFLTQGYGQIRFETSGYDGALEKAGRTNKLVFIYFYTDWCVPCKQLPGIVFVDSLIRSAIESKYVSLKLNAEKGEGVRLAKQFQVGGFPTFLFLDPHGKLLGRVEGTRSNSDYLVAIKSAGRIDPLRDELEQRMKARRDSTQRN
jgi:thiol:disulfide interchange protein